MKRRSKCVKSAVAPQKLAAARSKQTNATLSWYESQLKRHDIDFVRHGDGNDEVLAIDCPVCFADAKRRKCTIKQGTKQLVIACGKCGACGDELRKEMKDLGIPWVSPMQINSRGVHLKTRHLVYSAVLDAAGRFRRHGNNLRKRGFSSDDIRSMEVKSSDPRKRDEIVEWAVEQVNEEAEERFGNAIDDAELLQLLAKVPGVKVADDGFDVLLSAEPCMLLPIRNRRGQIIRLRTRLDNPGDGGKYRYVGRDESGFKIPLVHVPEPTVQLLSAAKEPKTIVIAEGELKADFVARRMERPAISMPGCRGYVAAIREARSLGAEVIEWAFDADHRTNPDVAKALIGAVGYCRQEGIAIRLLTWDPAYKGIDDIPKKHRGEIELIDGTQLDDYLDRLSARHCLAGVDGRRRITISPDRNAAVAEEVLAALSANDFYRMADGRIAQFDEAKCDFTYYDERSLPSQIDRFAVFQRFDKDGGLASCNLPLVLAQNTYHRVDFSGINRIESILDGPGLLPDGQMALTQGYHARSRVFVRRVPPGWDTSTHVRKNPTRHQAKQAYHRLHDLFVDFQVSDPSAPAVLVAAMLTIVGRNYIAANVPIFAVTAQQPGAGKTLATEVVGSVACGAPLPTTALLRDESQFRSDLTTQMRQGRQVIIFDNVADGKTVAKPVLSQLLTSAEWRDRLLRTNSEFAGPNRLTILITANRLTFSRELARRALVVEFAKQTKTSFKYGELKPYVQRHRAELLGHALTIWAWILRPDRVAPADPLYLASFPRFTELIAQPILTLSGIDIYRAVAEQTANYDADVTQLAELLAAIASIMRKFLVKDDRDGDGDSAWWYARDLLGELLNAGKHDSAACTATRAAAQTLFDFVGAKAGASYLGRRLTGLVDQPTDSWLLESRCVKNSNQYRLVRLTDADPD